MGGPLRDQEGPEDQAAEGQDGPDNQGMADQEGMEDQQRRTKRANRWNNSQWWRTIIEFISIGDWWLWSWSQANDIRYVIGSVSIRCQAERKQAK